MLINLKIEQIRIDGGTQQRPIDNSVVNEYAEAISGGASFPPLSVVYDEKEDVYWLWDGFHRYLAYQKLDLMQVEVDTYDGDLATAISWSYSANRYHGFRRQPGVIKDIIKKMLKDPLWENATHSDIAGHVGISRRYTSQLVNEIDTIHNGRSAHSEQGMSGNDDESQTENVQDSENTGCGTEPAEASLPGKDKAGQPIPINLIDLYNRRSVITGLMHRVSEIKSDVLAKVAERDILFTALNRQQFEADCNNLRNDLKKTEPYAVCPYCGGGDPEYCEACKGYGFIDKVNYDAAPRELKNEATTTV